MGTIAQENNTIIENKGLNPLVNYNFMLRVEGVFDLPCKTVHSFTKENEYEYIQEGGLNDYVHMRRKPISKPFTFTVERYVGTDYYDPLQNGTELTLPLILMITRYQNHFNVTKRAYVFTGCTVMSKEYGELNSERSGLHTEKIVIGYREMVVFTMPVDLDNSVESKLPINKTDKPSVNMNELALERKQMFNNIHNKINTYAEKQRDTGRPEIRTSLPIYTNKSDTIKRKWQSEKERKKIFDNIHQGINTYAQQSGAEGADELRIRKENIDAERKKIFDNIHQGINTYAQQSGTEGSDELRIRKENMDADRKKIFNNIHQAENTHAVTGKDYGIDNTKAKVTKYSLKENGTKNQSAMTTEDYGVDTGYAEADGYILSVDKLKNYSARTGEDYGIDDTKAKVTKYSLKEHGTTNVSAHQEIDTNEAEVKKYRLKENETENVRARTPENEEAGEGATRKNKLEKERKKILQNIKEGKNTYAKTAENESAGEGATRKENMKKDRAKLFAKINEVKDTRPVPRTSLPIMKKGSETESQE